MITGVISPSAGADPEPATEGGGAGGGIVALFACRVWREATGVGRGVGY